MTSKQEKKEEANANARASRGGWGMDAEGLGSTCCCDARDAARDGRTNSGMRRWMTD